MGEFRMRLRWICAGSMLLAAGAADAGNGNFERTVGSDVAHLAEVHADLSAQQRIAPAAKRMLDCELCEPVSPLVMREDRRLDQRLQSQYRQLGESLAARLWDDPKGRRVKFDIQGKPGLGLVIPFD